MKHWEESVVIQNMLRSQIWDVRSGKLCRKGQYEMRKQRGPSDFDECGVEVGLEGIAEGIITLLSALALTSFEMRRGSPGRKAFYVMVCSLHGKRRARRCQEPQMAA